MVEETIQEQAHTPAEEVIDSTELESVKQQLIATEDKYLRLFAEFENYRRRTATEKEELTKQAGKSIIEQLLPVLDSFGQSEAALAKAAANTEDLKKGFALIHKQLDDALAKCGVTKIVSLDTAFDPKLHEAIMQKEATEALSGTVLEELRTGYQLHEKVIRPAMVVVAQ